MKSEEYNQRYIFDDCATKCEAYAACGGMRKTAPCGCAWPLQSGLRYQCNKCYLICRDANKFNLATKRPKDFGDEISDGFTLDQVKIKQTHFNLPIFIPSLTEKYCSPGAFNKYIAVDIRMMFNCSRKGAAKLKPHFKTEQSVRTHLHVSSKCQLIAVLNGQDWMLESLWASQRMSILKQLFKVGFSICTGPTFSVTALTTLGTPVPFSHHSAMLMRHHKMMSEIADVGLYNVPNLYWLDGDARMMHIWSKWLCDNPEIYCITKDFTSTRQWPVIKQKLLELISLLAVTGRKFHIMIVGTGAANAHKVVKAITTAGHSVSIITSAPILKALHGSRYIVDSNGRLRNLICSKVDWPFSALMEHNLQVFEEDLENSRCNK